MRTQLVGDVKIEDLDRIEIIVPEANKESRCAPEAENETVPVIEKYIDPTEEDTMSRNIQQEDTCDAGPSTIDSGVPQDEEEVQSQTRKSKKRKQRKDEDLSWSEQSGKSDSDYEEGKKRKETKRKKDRPRRGKTDRDDPLAIDGRKKPDLSNRVRIKGRLGGYKEGFVSTSKRDRSKKKSPEASTATRRSTRSTPAEKRAREQTEEQEEETALTEPMATSTPAQKKRAQIIEELTRTPTIQPFVSLDTLLEADIERARRMRPPTPADPVIEIPGPQAEETAQPEAEAAKQPETIEEGDDDIVQSSQRLDDIGDGAGAAGESSQDLGGGAEDTAGPGRSY